MDTFGGRRSFHLAQPPDKAAHDSPGRSQGRLLETQSGRVIPMIKAVRVTIENACRFLSPSSLW